MTESEAGFNPSFRLVFRLGVLGTGLLLLLPPNNAQAEPLSALADGLARVFIHANRQVRVDNPFDWDSETWTKGAYTEEEIRAAFKELEERFPGDVEALRAMGRDYRHRVLDEIGAQSSAILQSEPPPRASGRTLRAGFETFLRSQGGAGIGKPTQQQVELMARGMTRARNAYANSFPESEWKDLPGVTTELYRNTTRAEDTETRSEQAEVSHSAFSAWKRVLKLAIEQDIAENTRQQLDYLMREYPTRFEVTGTKQLPDGKTRSTSDRIGLDELRELKLALVDSKDAPDIKRLTVVGNPDSRVAYAQGGWLYHVSPNLLGRKWLEYEPHLGNRRSDGQHEETHIHAGLEYVETLTELNKENFKLLKALEDLPFSSNQKKLTASVLAIVRAQEADLAKLRERTTFRRPIESPGGDLTTDLVWGRLAQDASFFDNRGQRALWIDPHLKDYLGSRTGPRSGFRRHLFPALLAGSILFGHIADDLYRTQTVQTGLERLNHFASVAAEKVGDSAKWVGDRLPDPSEWFRWGDPTGQSDGTEEGMKRTLPTLPPMEDDSTATERKTFKGLKESQIIQDEESDHGSKSKGDLADADEAADARNKYNESELEQKKQEIIWEIGRVGSRPLSDHIPTRFSIGYLGDAREQKTVPVPVNKGFFYGTEDGAFELRTARGRSHRASDDGKVLLPRAGTNVPTHVRVWSGGEETRDFNVSLTRIGELVLDIKDKAAARKPIAVSMVYGPNKLEDREADDPVFTRIDPRKIKKVNESLREAGATRMADLLDEVADKAQSSGKTLSLRDLEPAMRMGARYSYQPAQADKALPRDDFNRLKPFFNDGYVCYQCDGARDLLVGYLQKLFAGSSVPVEVRSARVLIREEGESTLSAAGMHAQVEVSVRGESKELVLDITPWQKDPRDAISEELSVRRHVQTPRRSDEEKFENRTVDRPSTSAQTEKPHSSEVEADGQTKPEKSNTAGLDSEESKQSQTTPETPAVAETPAKPLEAPSGEPAHGSNPLERDGKGLYLNHWLHRGREDAELAETLRKMKELYGWGVIHELYNPEWTDEERRNFLAHVHRRSLHEKSPVTASKPKSQPEPTPIERIEPPKVLSDKPPKPEAPEELADLLRKYRTLLAEAQRFPTLVKGSPGGPQKTASVGATQVTDALVRYLLTGHGLERAIDKMAQWTQTPDGATHRISSSEDFKKAIERLSDTLLGLNEKYAAAVMKQAGRRRNTGSAAYRGSLDPELEVAVVDLLQALKKYPWESAPDFEEHLGLATNKDTQGYINGGETNECSATFSVLSDSRYAISLEQLTAPSPRLHRRMKAAQSKPGNPLWGRKKKSTTP